MARQRFRHSRDIDDRRRPRPVKSIKKNAKLRSYLKTCSLGFLLILIAATIILSYNKLGKSKSMDAGESDAFSIGRSVTDISYQRVLSEANKSSVDSSFKRLNCTVLAYVTPWNGKGYEMAVKYRAKFTHVSPVWYQLKRVAAELELFGRHDADRQWISQVRRNGHPLILPRVLLEASPLELLTKKKERKRAFDLIISECLNMGYDGMVLEAWSQWAAYGILRDTSLRHMALNFIKELGSMMHNTKIDERHDQSLQLVLVIPPATSAQNSPDTFTSKDVATLSNDIDGLSLMTYDYSNVYYPGPNAPLGWVHECLQFLLSGTSRKDEDKRVSNKDTDNKLSKKVLVGLNFYGNDYTLPRGGRPIIGHEYVSLLATYRPTLIWDKEAMEHYFDYVEQSKQHRVFYPTPESISMRIEKARMLGAGLSIWEIGQGLECFFDLL